MEKTAQFINAPNVVHQPGVGQPGAPGSDPFGVDQNALNSHMAEQQQEQQYGNAIAEAIGEPAMQNEQIGVQQDQMDASQTAKFQQLGDQINQLQDQLNSFTADDKTLKDLRTVFAFTAVNGLNKEASLIDEVVVTLKQLLHSAKEEGQDTSAYVSQLLGLIGTYGHEPEEEFPISPEAQQLAEEKQKASELPAVAFLSHRMQKFATNDLSK